MNTVKKAYSKHKKNEKIPPRLPNRRKSSVSVSVGLNIKNQVKLNPKLSTRKLESSLKAIYGSEAPSKSSIHRFLQSQGYEMVTPIKKPMLSLKNVTLRLEFALEHMTKTQAFFNRILWSDETSVCLIPKKNCYKVRVHSSLKGKVTVPSTKSALTVMFWGFFSCKGPGPLIPIEGTMNSEKYVQILEAHLLPFLKKAKFNPIWMHDNAPCHSSKFTKSFLEKYQIKTLQWPPQSPDLNPIENAWAIIKRNVESQVFKPKSKQELIKSFTEEWNRVSAQTWSALMKSLPKRLHEVKKQKGQWTKY
jgi:transposase